MSIMFRFDTAFRPFYGSLIMLMAACIIGGLSSPNLISPSWARELPSSDEQHYNLSSSISAEESGYASLVNPALFSGGVNPQLQFFFEEDPDGRIRDDLNWGMAANMGFLGFGFRSVAPAGERVTDYTIALSGGDGRNFMGLAWNWSRNRSKSLRTPSYFSLGSLYRPFHCLSLGSVTMLTTENEKHDPFFRYTLGCGFRPFGDRFTMWLDLGMSDRDRLEDLDYHYGLQMEPVDGIVLGAKLDRLGNPGFNLGINFSYGGVSILSSHDNGFERSRRFYSLQVEGVRNRSVLEDLYLAPDYIDLELKGIGGYYEFLILGSDIRLKELLDGIERIREDGRVKGLLVRITDFQASPVMLEEIRRALADLDKSGKDVVIYWEGGNIGGYYLATAADCVVLNPVGLLDAGGIGRESIFWRSALERAGVEFKEYNIGAWKGAGETYYRDSFSPEVKENVTQYIDGLLHFFVSGAAEARGMKVEALSTLYEESLILTADECLAGGLVDTLLYEDQLEDFLRDRSEKCGSVQDYEMYMMIPDRKYTWGKDPTIAVIYACGLIYQGTSIGPLLMGDETVVEQLRRAGGDSDIKAVVLRVDSQGGDGFASDKIYREILDVRETKPVIVSQGFIAGSGGYYISCPGTRILASPISLTGSIGVAAGMFLGRDLFDRFELKQDGIIAGKNAAPGGAVLPGPRFSLNSVNSSLALRHIPFLLGRPLTESQDEDLRNALTNFYRKFVTKISVTRDMTWDDVHAVGEGRIWSGRRAKELGLLDKLGGLADAILEARKAAGLPLEEDVRILEIYPELGFFQRLLLSRMGLISVRAREREIAEEASRVSMEILGSGTPHLHMSPDLLSIVNRSF